MLKCYWADIVLLENSQVFELWLEKVNSQRREKVLRCKQDIDQKRSLLAGVLLRYALEQEGLCYETLVFGVEENGKPILESQNGIEFSISHAGNYVLCCISDELIGADIEVAGKSIFHSEKEEKLERMAARVLAPSEYMLFLDRDFEQKKRLFLKYWTRKESYSKAIGKGLAMDFSKIDTENMTGSFWSDWLEEDGFCSIYTVKESCTGMTFQKINHLEL